MRTIIFLLFFNSAATVTCQPTLASFDLPFGQHPVGYAHYTRHDQSRSYREIYSWSNRLIPRPIAISVWYPAKSSGRSHHMFLSDYLKVVKNEEEWPMLPDERILGWFAYPDNPENRKRLTFECKSVLKAATAKGKFPVVIYAPGYEATSVENFALCEFLASHGYVVLAAPSKGNNHRFMNGATASDLETQSRDIQFLISEAMTMPNADATSLCVVGHSFGGMANILARMQNDFVKSLVCLDGSIKYQLPTIEATPSFDFRKMTTPLLFIAQKNIPVQLMLEEGIDTTLNNSFRFFDSLKSNEAFYIKSKVLTHGKFTSMGVLLQPLDPRQDGSESAIFEAYREMNIATLNFLHGVQTNNGRLNIESLQSLSIIEEKRASSSSKSFEDFMTLVHRSDFSDLESIYYKLKNEDAAFKADEWKLNSLGLRLVFAGLANDGITLLNFTTKLYPHSSNAFDSLAEAYLLTGDIDNAVRNFKRAIELDPANSNSAHQLEKLTK